MPKLLGEYHNGNYNVRIYDTGTKIRETEEDDFIPEFPECMDVNISTLCSRGCKFCYANCSPNGKHADLDKYMFNGFFDGIHPYTEIAVNINSNLDNDKKWIDTFERFLKYTKKRKVIVNATINQMDFCKYKKYIKELIKKHLIWGLGISLKTINEDSLEELKEIPNAVIHTIVGVTTPQQYLEMKNQGLKILILGYKEIGRGKNCFKDVREKNQFEANKKWLNDNLKELSRYFEVISFDNLALEQLDVKSLLTEEEYNERFLGSDGEFSFYLDLVNDRFSLNSLKSHDETYPIGEKSIKECFDFVRSHKNN